MKPTDVLLLGALLVVAATGCIRPPDVVLLDRKTALERQASGEFPSLEAELLQAGLSPKGDDFTRAQLAEAGWDTSRGRFDEIVRIYGQVRGDAERVDVLLTSRCLGEGVDGLLAQTPATCTGGVRPDEAARLVERTNRSRRQVWRYLLERRPSASEAEVVEAWRRNHLKSMVCGGQLQAADGSWSTKMC